MVPRCALVDLLRFHEIPMAERVKPYDLNKPADARRYLLALELHGSISFTGMDTVKALSDEEVLEVAAMVFQKFHYHEKRSKRKMQ